VNVSITAGKAYTHYVRVPEWTKRNDHHGTIALNGGAAKALAPNADSLQAIRAPGQYCALTWRHRWCAR
jgi:hypothetical protein